MSAIVLSLPRAKRIGLIQVRALPARLLARLGPLMAGNGGNARELANVNSWIVIFGLQLYRQARQSTALSPVALLLAGATLMLALGLALVRVNRDWLTRL